MQLWDKEEQRKTVFFVTHSVDEALLLATDIVVLGQSPSKVIYTHHFDEDKRPQRDTMFSDPEIMDLRNTLFRIIDEEIQAKARAAKEAHLDG